MWKKFLAVGCIPFVALLMISLVQTLFKTFSQVPEGTASYRMAYHVGTGLGALITAVLLFFWSRWIWRILVPRPPAERVE